MPRRKQFQIVTVPTVLEQKLIGTPIATKTVDVRDANQWFIMQSEQFRKSIVGHVKGALQYGCVVTWHLLPVPAQTALLDAYAAHVASKENQTMFGSCHDCAQGVLAPVHTGFAQYRDDSGVDQWWYCLYCGSNHVTIKDAAGNELFTQGNLYQTE